MTVNTAVNAVEETEKEIITPFFVLNDRFNHRMVVQANLVKADDPRNDKFKKVEDITVGLRDSKDLEHYIMEMRTMAVRNFLNEGDKQELAKPVADYCDTHELTRGDLMVVHLFRADQLFSKGMVQDNKDAIDYAMVRAAKSGNEFLAQSAKGFLFTGNMVDIIVNPPSDEALLEALEKANTLGDERDVFIEENYVVVEKKFAPRLNQ